MSEEFEKWAVGEGYILDRMLGIGISGRAYVATRTQDAWNGWQASRKQALFEAAAKCDEWGHHLEQFDSAKAATADTCAELIREIQQQ